MSETAMRRVELKTEQLKLILQQQELKALKVKGRIESAARRHELQKTAYQCMRGKFEVQAKSSMPPRAKLLALNYRAAQLKAGRRLLDAGTAKVEALGREQGAQRRNLAQSKAQLDRLHAIRREFQKQAAGRSENLQYESLQEILSAVQSSLSVEFSCGLPDTTCAGCASGQGAMQDRHSMPGQNEQARSSQAQILPAWEQVLERIKWLQKDAGEFGLELTYRALDGLAYGIRVSNAAPGGGVWLEISSPPGQTRSALWREKERLMAELHKAGIRIVRFDIRRSEVSMTQV